MIICQLEERQRLNAERQQAREQQTESSRELRQDRERYRTMEADPPSPGGLQRGEVRPSAKEQFMEERRRAQNEPQPQRQRPKHDRER